MTFHFRKCSKSPYFTPSPLSRFAYCCTAVSAPFQSENSRNAKQYYGNDAAADVFYRRCYKLHVNLLCPVSFECLMSAASDDDFFWSSNSHWCRLSRLHDDNLATDGTLTPSLNCSPSILLPVPEHNIDLGPFYTLCSTVVDQL